MKFRMTELVDNWEVETARVGSDTIANAGDLTDNEKGKFVKLVGDSRYDLAVAGDPIEGWITSVEVGSYDGYRIGGVAVARPTSRKEVIFDGTVAVGDYVVTGTVVAKGTPLPLQYVPRVAKAGDQAAARTAPFKARVVSLGDVGTGAAGTMGVIEFV